MGKQATERKFQLNGIGWWKYGCGCCGPKDSKEHKVANRWLRRKRKLCVKSEAVEDL